MNTLEWVQNLPVRDILIGSILSVIVLTLLVCMAMGIVPLAADNFQKGLLNWGNH
ncbi:hypothetical protein [Paenibacillus periandrae]|uniref:hypothetical protein n=1 Tax=Paenibacillus periandrae TaxID=1761741 RepID=UPI001F08D682|nr:hypothetical protein [Paenibacillus periandrae]